jgi:hypothetical protein
MSNEIIYKQASLHDEPIIAEFFQKAYNSTDDYKYPDRFEWMYKKNPYNKTGEMLPIWLAIDGGMVVGMSTLMHQLFTINGVDIQGAWCCDLRILSDYRRMGIATQLEKLRMADCDVFSVSSSEISIKIKEKLGYIVRPAFTSYVYISKFDPNILYEDLSRYLRFKNNPILYNLGYRFGIHRIVSSLFNIIFRYIQKRNLQNNHPLGKKLNAKKIDKFDFDASLFWDNIKGKFGFAANRDAEYLNWKYIDQKNMHFKNYLFFYHNNIVGVLVIRKEKNVGIIADIIVDPDDEFFAEIFQFGVSELLRQHADIIICCGSLKKHKDIIERFGFITIKNHYGVFYNSSRHTNYKNLIHTIPWLIGYGDHDIDEPNKIFHPSLLTLLKVLFYRRDGAGWSIP